MQVRLVALPRCLGRRDAGLVLAAAAPDAFEHGGQGYKGHTEFAPLAHSQIGVVISRQGFRSGQVFQKSLTSMFSWSAMPFCFCSIF